MEEKRGWRIGGPYKDLEGYRTFYFSTVGPSRQGEDPVTYIHWNDKEVDTVRTESHRWKTGCEVVKVWIDGELRWECEPFKRQGPRLIRLVK